MTADGEEVARTDSGFWGRTPTLSIDGETWAFQVEQEGLIGARDGADRLAIERGRIWHASWPMVGLAGLLQLTRTTSWLFGRLHFDLHRDGERVAAVVPEGPWRYRPTVDATAPLSHAEAVFVLWAACRIDARRPMRQIRPGTGGYGGGSI